LTRLSETKLEIIGAKMVRVSKGLAEEHYRDLKGQPFFPELIRYLQGDLHKRPKVMAMVYWGPDAITKVRELAGATNPEEAVPTSIRGSFGRIRTTGLFENVIHASSSPADAEREIKLWFNPDDILTEIYPSKEVVEREIKRRVWAG